VFAKKSKQIYQNTKTKISSFITNVKLCMTIAHPQFSEFLYTILERLPAPSQFSLYNCYFLLRQTAFIFRMRHASTTYK